jgi:TPR repeat protein
MTMLVFRVFIKFLIATSIILSADVSANKLDRAVEAMRSGDFAVAYCIMRPLAEIGDPEAQYNIGWMYMNGYGLRVNDRLALEWWQKAARQKHADASFSIAMLYSMGEGDIPKDSDKAIDYYLLALQEGHEDAISVLQSMILRNDRVIRRRIHSIVGQHVDLFGTKRQVKAEKLNARNGPTVENEIIVQLLKGQTVLEMYKQGRWSQVVVLDDESIDRTVWVYNPLLENGPEG